MQIAIINRDSLLCMDMETKEVFDLPTQLVDALSDDFYAILTNDYENDHVPSGGIESYIFKLLFGSTVSRFGPQDEDSLNQRLHSKNAPSGGWTPYIIANIRRAYQIMEPLFDGLKLLLCDKESFSDFHPEKTNIGYSLGQNNGEFIDLFSFKTLEDFLYFSVAKIVQSKIIVKCCENCRQPFIPKNRTDEIYCDRIKNGKTCKNIGYYNKIMTDDNLKMDREFRKSYKTKNAQKQRMIKGKSETYIDKAEQSFSIWVKSAKEKLELTRQGNLEQTEFISWLNNDWRKK